MDFADSDAFENAAAAARSDLGGVSPDEQLELYGLYKQSVEGDCVSAKPAIWDMTARAKWHAWQAQVGLGKKDAQELYVQLVAALLATPGSSAAQGTSIGGAKSVSTLGALDGDGASPASWGAGDHLLDAASSGKLDDVDAALSAAEVDLHRVDAEGRNALHFAADRGHASVCARLVAAGIDVNARDGTGLTPLAYAVTCEHADCVVALVERGADSSLADDDGDTPASTASAAMHALLGTPSP
ncbi:membrane acyl-CoA binding protein [Pelagophyceae sp. CCMP2097]|nr:membrane acyl-CoA binding protein [Pelagophyceae sp. CCMP2097]|mmetsp:Transcript_27160/g.93819  ORF Transcript_27160/g.93819 Transcript_27160/m.93819 type:complete len:243 (+) Transcript_27160:80-808(+)